MERQAQLVPLEFLAAGSDEVRRRYPGLDPDQTLRELTVVGDNRAVYRGGRAWVMCLWALRDYRIWAGRLAAPHMLPVAERAFRELSRRRLRLGGLARILERASTA